MLSLTSRGLRVSTVILPLSCAARSSRIRPGSSRGFCAGPASAVPAFCVSILDATFVSQAQSIRQSRNAVVEFKEDLLAPPVERQHCAEIRPAYGHRVVPLQSSPVARPAIEANQCLLVDRPPAESVL